MTNLTRANGTLKIVNRKIGSEGVSGVAELSANGHHEPGAGSGRSNSSNNSNNSNNSNGNSINNNINSCKGLAPVIEDEDLKENRLRADCEQPSLQAATPDGAGVRLKHRLALLAKERRDSHESTTAPADEPTNELGLDLKPGGSSSPAPFEPELVWFNIFLFVVLHSAIPVGLYQFYTQLPWLTTGWSVLGMYLSGLGVTGGAHRLWSHRSYKASRPVEILLMLLQTMAGQNSIYTWCRDHRVHHKFSETDADPHNIKRGFFFAHMGWLCCKKHPEVKSKGKLIDMSDLEANPVVMFQHRHFWWLAILCTVLAPTYVPVLLWRERFWTSFVFSFMLRYLITLHGTWLVNSAAHYFGSRPYDARIEARESPFVIATGLGEGFHNYHHTFPFDYSTSEFGKYFNITTAFIDACAALSLVHDRRKMDRAMIESRMARTGELQLACCSS